MIIEYEVLEQLLDDDWSLSRVITFLEASGADPWPILLRHTQDNNLVLLDMDSNNLPVWKVQEIIQNRSINIDVMVHCTDKGGKLVT